MEFSGPFLFNETISSDRFLHMLQNNFVLQLMATEMPLDMQWSVQDGATPHTANKVLDFLTTLPVHMSAHNIIQIVTLVVIFGHTSTALEPMRLLFMGFHEGEGIPNETCRLESNNYPAVCRDYRRLVL
jgi:hypothetical protein